MLYITDIEEDLGLVAMQDHHKPAKICKKLFAVYVV